MISISLLTPSDYQHFTPSGHQMLGKVLILKTSKSKQTQPRSAPRSWIEKTLR